MDRRPVISTAPLARDAYMEKHPIHVRHSTTMSSEAVPEPQGPRHPCGDCCLFWTEPLLALIRCCYCGSNFTWTSYPGRKDGGGLALFLAGLMAPPSPCSEATSQ